MRAKVKGLANQMESEKTAHYSPALLAFDEKVQAYRAETLSLGDYVRELRDVSDDFTLVPSLRQFAEALDMERTLNFSRVELERADMIEGLTRKLDPQETNRAVGSKRGLSVGATQLRWVLYGIEGDVPEKGVSLVTLPCIGCLRALCLAGRWDRCWAADGRNFCAGKACLRSTGEVSGRERTRQSISWNLVNTKAGGVFTDPGGMEGIR
jgi:hypothetical protein